MMSITQVFKIFILTALSCYVILVEARGNSPVLTFADHGHVNPFTGGVAWETSNHPDVMSMEWAFIGLSDVLPLCSGGFDWTSVEDFLSAVDARGHQGILRPVIFGPGYGQENFAPSDLLVNAFVYDSSTYDNPAWNEASVQACILKFIDAFAVRYKGDQRVAYVQMGLAGLWGEHHLDGANYTAVNFPTKTFQKTMIEHFIDGFGHTPSDIQTSLSLDSAQDHGFFSSADTSLDNLRFGFFDDSLLTNNHGGINNWRQDLAPAMQLALHKQHGWGGEAYWSGCNSNGSWTTPPNDCGNGESLGDQAQRIGLNYMLGSPAFDNNNITAATLLTASQLIGYKFTATSVTRHDLSHVKVTVENTGAAFSPYKIEVCTNEGCSGDLSTLKPGDSVVLTVPATASSTQTLFFTSPRLNPSSTQKIRWSNVSADDEAATLTVDVSMSDLIFEDGFD
ncbi:hypothetical protein [Marinicella rhabdoformis]|uniref:hypothetical protein n=1 Tax=Marinicella rhabdoformis TaxID=2580566 RepID=UPI0012AEC882|nr:hypothetical protein [Marinicella rhabdoformis]